MFLTKTMNSLSETLVFCEKQKKPSKNQKKQKNLWKTKENH